MVNGLIVITRIAGQLFEWYASSSTDRLQITWLLLKYNQQG